jgi:proteasome accessory factor A
MNKTKRLLGVETEYAVNSQSSSDTEVERSARLWQLMDLARASLPYLSDFGNGMFLGNGSRLYVDCGMHPELSTPECADPWEVVRYILAGEQLLVDLAAKLEGGARNLSFYKCNVDYSGAGTTWGCHESYLHRMDPTLISEAIIPHLVSRIIYTGAGGFNSLSAGLEFTLSPRVPHLASVVSGNSTYDRAIFHTKDESLSSEGYHRLHLICGESLCSQTAMWLKAATTALVVALAEAGIGSDDFVWLNDPLAALKSFAADTRCKAKAQLTNGRWLNAIEIQRFYLRLAEAHARDRFMPAWAEEACRRWRLMLDRLESGPEAVETTLDWAIKLALYKNYAERQGFNWQSLAHWTHVHASLRAALAAANFDERSISIDSMLGPGSPVRDEVERLNPYLREHELKWDDLNKFLRLRRQLFEIDTRFGQLGDKGIFAELSRKGVLTHGMPGVGDISTAVHEPPATGRARLRGEFIRRVPDVDRGRYECDWQGVWDREERCALDLSDPFASQEQWHRIDAQAQAEDKYRLIPLGIRARIIYLEESRYFHY